MKPSFKESYKEVKKSDSIPKPNSNFNPNKNEFIPKLRPENCLNEKNFIPKPRPKHNLKNNEFIPKARPKNYLNEKNFIPKPRSNKNHKINQFIPKSRPNNDLNEKYFTPKNKPQIKTQTKSSATRQKLFNDGKNKECGRCQQIKPLNQFTFRTGKGKRYPKSTCKKCDLENKQIVANFNYSQQNYEKTIPFSEIEAAFQDSPYGAEKASNSAEQQFRG